MLFDETTAQHKKNEKPSPPHFLPWNLIFRICFAFFLFQSAFVLLWLLLQLFMLVNNIRHHCVIFARRLLLLLLLLLL